MMVSIPYGKGKDDRLQLINDIIIIVSIPYGKGKVARRVLRIRRKSQRYQFPMGKVKEAASLTQIKAHKAQYQFPMGKVKNNILRCVFIIIHRYRFVK